jgi:hypothetical protein
VKMNGVDNNVDLAVVKTDGALLGSGVDDGSGVLHGGGVVLIHSTTAVVDDPFEDAAVEESCGGTVEGSDDAPEAGTGVDVASGDGEVWK